MSTPVIYRIRFKNIEQKTVTITIADRPTTGENPFNIQYSVVDNGNGTQTVTFTWNPFPITGSSQVFVSYSPAGLNSYTDVEESTTSPASITIITGDYDYRVRIIVDVGVEGTVDFPFTQIIDLERAGDPCHIQVVDNNEDKFTPIKAKRAVNKFLSDPSNNMAIFADGPDDKWFCTIEIESQIVFKGFLTADDLEEDFLPPTNEVTLIASDKLGALKDIPFTDDSGINPQGKYRIAEIIALCLKKTKLNLRINVINNLRHGSGSLIGVSATFAVTLGANTITFTGNADFFYKGQKLIITSSGSNNGTFYVTQVGTILGLPLITVAETVVPGSDNIDIQDGWSLMHFYDAVYLDAKTFEDKIGTCIDCYSVLEKILGEDCFLTQYKGEWWIVRVDELDDNTFYIGAFTADGVFDGTTSLANNKTVGFGEALYFSQERTSVHPERENGFIKETYRFETPQEIVCNMTFERGDLVNTISDTEKEYDLDCWTLREGVPGFYGTVDGTTFKIKRIFDLNGYEQDRYIVLTPRTSFETSSINDATYIESEAIPVHEKDKFNASIDWRLDAAIATGGAEYRLFRFVLHGDDGSWWILGNRSALDPDTPLQWKNTLNWTTFTGTPVNIIDFDSIDENEWQNISFESPPIPADGNLYVWLNQFNQTGDSNDDVNINYRNLNFEYFAFINGNYLKYVSQYNKVFRADTGYLAKRDKQVYISDSPKKLFKGAMFVNANGAYVLIHHFYKAALFSLGSPASLDDCRPYGEWQAYSVWNQYRNANRVFNYSIQGDKDLIGFGEIPPDLINKFILNDTSPHSNNRYFMLLHFNHDLFLCESTGSLGEVFRTDLGRIYTETNEFKLESENR